MARARVSRRDGHRRHRRRGYWLLGILLVPGFFLVIARNKDWGAHLAPLE